MVKHEHSLLPYRFGERDLNVLLRNWRRLGVGMEGRNCRQPSACLLVYDPSHPIPVSLPFIPGLDSDSLRKYRRMLCVTRLQILPSPVPSSCHPTGSVSLSIFCSNVALPPPRSKVGQAAATFLQLRGNRSWLDGSFSLARITGEVSLPGSRRVINSFGSPSHGRILSDPASTDTCYLPFRVGRSLMINSKDPDRIYTFVLVKFLARERKGLEMR